MADLMYIGISLIFFALTFGLVWFFNSLSGDNE